MAKFCFISFAQAGHCDFGGMSYLRTATELKRRGHQVAWVLSRYPILKRYKREEHFERALNLVKRFGVDVEECDGLHQHLQADAEALPAYARNFAGYLYSKKIDCVVVDRLCVVAALSAHLAGLPWATIGTDGRQWTIKRLRSVYNPGVLPGYWAASPLYRVLAASEKSDFPAPSKNSYWATSPFLNISFFPRAYYRQAQDEESSPHSHFVGCGAMPEPNGNRRYLLVTFGNTFDALIRRKLEKLLMPLLRKLAVEVLFLAGNSKLAAILHRSYRHVKGVTVKEWMPYDAAYRDAVGVLGHGGTSHIWYGLREGIPLLAVPFMADQFFGALQLERLNVGRSVIPTVVPWHLSRSLQILGRCIPDRASVHLNQRELRRKTLDLLSDTTLRDSSIHFSQLMRKGGGVSASSSLLERLAQHQKPVSTCVSPSCCC